MSDLRHIDGLLAPRSVALIGASEDVTRIGGRPVAAMLAAGFKGDIWPVNPKRDMVQGLPCYADVDALPGTPDAAIIAVPAKLVAQTVEALDRCGCNAATLFSAGFAETGEAGAAAQADLVARVKTMRLLGPNTLGVYNVDIGYYGTFSSSLDTGWPVPGNIGIASQSGAFGAHLGALARDRGLGCSVFISTGNEADITVADAIHWMAKRDGTDVICAYMEGVNNPAALLAALNAARAAGKTVVILKSGRSTVGANAAASHTASLVGDAAVADIVFQAHGAIMVRDPQTMMDIAHVASKGVRPQTHSLGVITVSGGAGIVISDEAERIGLPMPSMPTDAQARLKEVLPYSSPVNPLDCTAQALNDLTLFETFTRAALSDGGYGAVLCFLTYVAGSPAMSEAILASLRPLRTEFPNCIIAICALGPPEVMACFEEDGFVVFDDPCRAVRAINALTAPSAPVRVTPEPLGVVLPDSTPDEAAAKRLLAAAGIACAQEEVVHDAESAVAAASRMDGAVVMKILSPDILHKSDIGAVLLDLTTDDEVHAAYSTISDAVAMHAPDATVTGMLVARQMRGGVECLMGISRDPIFGPVAAFGLGGIFVELMGDVAIHPCPFDQETAREMIGAIRGAGVLQGARGQPAVDVDALAAMLSRLSRLATGAGSRLVSIDLNPVLALPEGAFALDAMIELEDAS